MAGGRGGRAGATVWTTPGTCPTNGGCDPVVSGNRVYMWEASPSGPKITAVDLGSGARLYSGPGIVGGFIQQAAPFAGPDGTVYAPRTQNNPVTDFLVAYDDTGSVLSTTPPIAADSFHPRMAIGADGNLFLTNGAFGNGALLAYTANLDLSWSVPIGNVNVGGPALADGGILVVGCPAPGQAVALLLDGALGGAGPGNGAWLLPGLIPPSTPPLDL